MQVVIPSQLHEYTAGRSRVEAAGGTLGEVLDDLDRRYPGLRFRVVDEQGRVRPHIRFFVNRQLAAALSQPLQDGDELVIVGALSGG